jgi:hypothetical protein
MGFLVKLPSQVKTKTVEQMWVQISKCENVSPRSDRPNHRKVPRGSRPRGFRPSEEWAQVDSEGSPSFHVQKQNPELGAVESSIRCRM